MKFLTLSAIYGVRFGWFADVIMQGGGGAGVLPDTSTTEESLSEDKDERSIWEQM